MISKPRPPTPRSLILNLLLAADDATLGAREAINACALFGIRENSVRVALVRLSAAGMVEAAERGRYRLGPAAVGLAGEVANWRDAERRTRDWRGDWIAVHLAKLPRRRAHEHERALSMLGLRELDPGLHLRPDNLAGGVDAVRTRLATLGVDERAAVFVIRHLDTAREARARRLWDGKHLSRLYRERRAALERWMTRADALELEVAAREAYLHGNEAIRQLVFDPWLPAPLVDVDARRAYVATVKRFDDFGHRIWRRLHQLPLPTGTEHGAHALH
ncbi:PaaX family transcriptional regulator C-terminal domain-containing protein [Sinimarinibacterium thermocellulolyticum]|uniref:PaaX family transcriptional regulator C-terminal domain-containing protein n=1 Tax=Sinimarinibacterium thermocellulolyticum TaxID=3170016 RepID=A0ABV2ABP8_9GAMM